MYCLWSAILFRSPANSYEIMSSIIVLYINLRDYKLFKFIPFIQMEYILNSIVIILAYLSYEFFFVKKSSDSLIFGSSFETDYTRIYNLYKKIKTIKKIKHAYLSNNNIELIVRSSIDTMHTVLSSRVKNLIDRMLTPRKFNNQCYALPYYHHGQFYYALIPARTYNRSSILSIAGYPSKRSNNFFNRIWHYFYPSNAPKYDDITNEIIKYIGPEGNFYNKYVTAHDFGYMEIVFEFLDQEGTRKLIFCGLDRIVF